jgi:hypothetical protein
MTNDFQGVVYYAVGAFSRAQRAERDSQLLKDAGSKSPAPHPRSPPTSVAGPDVPSHGLTGRLRLVVRNIAHRDDNVSFEIERFQPWWPGKDSSGNPRRPEEAFSEWLAGAEGKARFGNASAVALHAIHVDFESEDK